MQSYEGQSLILNFVGHVQIPNCRGHSPTVVDISPTVADISPIFHIQSCCMMSMYHNSEYNPSIRNIL